MYIANENATQVDAYFDDVTMTYTPTNVVQYNDYYPFGLQTSTSWTRDDNKNNFLYNQGGELNATTGLYDLAYRNYDPAIGRFQQVDPLAAQYHSYSSYNYALNNPVMMNDPSGAKADDPWGTMTGVDKTLGRLQAWSDFMDSFNPFYSGSHGGGGGSGYGQWYRYSQYYAEAQSSYDNDLIARAKSGNANAIGEYSAHYGYHFELKATDYYANGIVDEDHYIDTQYSWIQTQGRAVILDANGNIKRFDNGANMIYVDTDKGLKLFHDKLVSNGSMSAAGFSNGLMSILNGMTLPNKTKLDPNKIYNGKISLALTSGVVYNEGQIVRTLDNWEVTRFDGLYKINYTHISGESLTVRSIQSILGIHEYYAHGVLDLKHPTDNAIIDALVKNYLSN